jgi:hypothetical protein
VAKTGADTYGGFGLQEIATENYATQWVGYFPVPTTGDYNVHLIGDDLVYFWIGTAALEGNFNFSNYHHIVNNGNGYNTNSLALTGGLYYPVRMWFQEFGGAESAQVLIGPAASNALAMNQYTIVNNSQTEGHNPASPTYTITPVADNVDEGSSLEFTIGGTNITNGTYYWTVDGNGPFDDGENGSFEIANNLGSITVTPTADEFTDGSATFTLSIRSVDIFGTILATSESITINDTSLTPTPTYTLTPAANNVNEGSSLTITVGGTNITNGTYYWTVETGAGDFTTNTGEVSVTDNSGSFTVTPTEDSTTEGLETFTVALRSGSVSGSILQTSESITINDTSLAPPFSLEFNNSQQDFLRVDASSSFNLGTTWTIEFWMSANGSGVSSNPAMGNAGLWGLLNQGGWTSANQITVAISDAKLCIGGKDNGDDVRFAEPTPNGVPSGSVTKISDNQGWDENNVGTNLPTTGGTGVGLTVDIIDGGSFYSAITINTPGSGYTNGDEITVTRPDISDTFTISVPNPVVWTHVAVVNNSGTQKVYYNGIEQSIVSGTFDSGNYTSSSEDIYIGRLAPNYGGYFDGKMALIRISNTAKYLTAFTPSTTYNVEADTVLLLDSDTPLIGQSYFELNGVITSASNGITIYFAKATYPDLNNQVQAGDTVVDTSTSDSSTVTGAVLHARW